MPTMLEGALKWAAAGIPVFPCASNKRPMTPNGLYDASTDPAVVERMFKLAGDDCMIGARMGSEAGLFACDFDIYKSGEAGESARRFMAELLAKGLLPESQKHKTMSGGLHVIFSSEHSWPNCVPVDGVEVKGEGGYIILPPSRGYSVEDGGGFAEAPTALIELLVKAKRQYTDRTTGQHQEDIIAANSFHEAATSIAAKMFRQGRTAAEVMDAISDALQGSVAKSPHHPRHDRWRSLATDESGELSRIINSARSKYDTKSKTADAKAAVEESVAERLNNAAKGIFAPPPTEQTSPNEGKQASPDDYAGAWPFEGEGYFAHDHIDIKSQKFVMYPLYAENESVVMAADPKAGKTAISLKMAFAIAIGQDLGGMKVTEPRGVLYFSLEGTRAVKLRIEAEKRHRIALGETLPDDIPLFVVERHMNFMQKQDEVVAKIVAADRWFFNKTGRQLGLIAIDTLTKAMPGSDQNSVDDTSKLFSIISEVRNHGVTATIVFIHHTGKDGKTRGSSNIEAEVDVVLKVRKNDDGTSVMYVHMARSIDDDTTYLFRLQSFDLDVTDQGIMQKAPVVIMEKQQQSAHGEVSENASRAMKLKPFMLAILALGVGTHGIGKVLEKFKAEGIINGRVRKTALKEPLDMIFDRSDSVSYSGHIVTAVKDADGYKELIVSAGLIPEET